MEKKRDKRGRLILEEMPYNGLRKVIGDRMSESLARAPQGTVMSRADMSNVIKFRQEQKLRGFAISYTDIFVKIIACAVKELPIMNSTRNDDVITIFESVNVGVAIKIDSAIVVPVVSEAQDKTVIEIAKETREMITNVRNGDFASVPMGGGTITVNNLGMFDVDGCTPFVNLPEASILAIGSIRQEAVVDEDGRIVAKPMTTLSLTIDHSIADGGPAAEFLGIMKKIMAEPEMYLI
jgi:pyruvate dehydrogenase E2 component (dihydrolipoamide acetyltransferase)